MESALVSIFIQNYESYPVIWPQCLFLFVARPNILYAFATLKWYKLKFASFEHYKMLKISLRQTRIHFQINNNWSINAPSSYNREVIRIKYITEPYLFNTLFSIASWWEKSSAFALLLFCANIFANYFWESLTISSSLLLARIWMIICFRIDGILSSGLILIMNFSGIMLRSCGKYATHKIIIGTILYALYYMFL